MTIKFVLKQLDSTASQADGSVLGEYVFDGSLFTIGSDSACTIVLNGAATEQFVVVQEVELLTLINSAEGTSLNGRNLRREAIEPLAFGDEIRIGNYVISVVSYAAASEINENGGSISINKTSLPEPIAPVMTGTIEKTSLFAQNGKSEPAAIKPARNFADILNTLRTEEDSFYFIVKSENEAETRIPLEQTEMPLGFDALGKISCEVTEIANLYAIVRKDWSGIIVESQRVGAILVNGETLNTPRRLRNGDAVNFNPTRKGKPLPSLELHEPSSLVALESILETRPGNETKITNGSTGTGNPADDALTAKQTVPVLERSFFGYFSFFEVAAMAIGTLIAAVVIFLLLEFIVG